MPLTTIPEKRIQFKEPCLEFQFKFITLNKPVKI